MGFFMMVVMIESVVDISGWRVYVGFFLFCMFLRGKGGSSVRIFVCGCTTQSIAGGIKYSM